MLKFFLGLGYCMVGFNLESEVYANCDFTFSEVIKHLLVFFIIECIFDMGYAYLVKKADDSGVVNLLNSIGCASVYYNWVYNSIFLIGMTFKCVEIFKAICMTIMTVVLAIRWFK